MTNTVYLAVSRSSTCKKIHKDKIKSYLLHVYTTEIVAFFPIRERYRMNRIRGGRRWVWKDLKVIPGDSCETRVTWPPWPAALLFHSHSQNTIGWNMPNLICKKIITKINFLFILLSLLHLLDVLSTRLLMYLRGYSLLIISECIFFWVIVSSLYFSIFYRTHLLHNFIAITKHAHR